MARPLPLIPDSIPKGSIDCLPDPASCCIRITWKCEKGIVSQEKQRSLQCSAVQCSALHCTGTALEWR